MRVTIEAEVFGSPEVSDLDLCALFRHAYKDRCRILVWPVYVPSIQDDGHPVAIWLRGLTPKMREECSMSLSLGLEAEMRHPSERCIRVALQNASDWKKVEPVLPISQVLNFLEKPFRILVENNRNDRAFLLAVANDADRHFVKSCEMNGWSLF